MTYQHTPRLSLPQRTIATLIDRHGRWAVLVAAMRAIAGHRRAQRQRRLDSVSDHVRRDIGLRPLPQSPPIVRPPF